MTSLWLAFAFLGLGVIVGAWSLFSRPSERKLAGIGAVLALLGALCFAVAAFLETIGGRT